MIQNLFLNEVQINNRIAVENSEVGYRPDDAIVTGHIFESDGRYRTYYLENNIENIARFIKHNKKDKLLCNSSDYAILCTIGDIVDKSRDEELLNDLLPSLKKVKSATAFEYR